jgi:hypothetical protein
MFEYGNPDAILDVVLSAPSKPETALDDFEHFCSVTGCDRRNAWAKLAFAWESAEKTRREAALLDRIQELEALADRAAQLIGRAVTMMGRGDADD